MAILTRKRLQALLHASPGPCVSMYLPTHRNHPDTEQDPIRFRNAIKQAEKLLSDHHSEAVIRGLLDPVAEIATHEFWRHQSEGLAVLRSADVLEEFRLPIPVPELVVVADSFHVRPLIRSLNASERFFLLALDQGGCELFEGVAGSLRRLEVEDMPRALASFGAKEGRRNLGAHATSRGGGSRQTHAAGGVATDSDADLSRYFRAVDRAVTRAVQHEGAPVILAGVDHLFPVYRKISRLRHLAEATIPGSPQATSHDSLRDSARAVANAILEANAERALEKYRRAAERGRSSDRLEDIFRLARRGKVRRLFVARTVHVWGRVDPNTGEVHRSEMQQGSHDDDLLDDVAESVYAYGGEVIAIPLTKMPRAAEAVAELR